MLVLYGVFFILAGLVGLWAARRYNRPTPGDMLWSKISRGRFPSMAAYGRMQIISSAIFMIVGIVMLILAAL